MLEQYLVETVAGRPRVVLIQGEAGIGKTRLLREFHPLAQQHGVVVCYGRCHEDLALPYRPFAESLFSQLAQPPSIIEHKLEAETAIIRRFLQHAETASPSSSMTQSAGTEQETLRLFLAFTRTTVALAQYRPTALILDDLHWADRSSLDLFVHLVLAVADAAMQEPVPLLILAAYRPVEPEDRLARTLARCRREELCQTIELQGFSESEIDELLQSLGLSRPAHQLISTVSEATHGNPLFIQETLHQLLHSGVVVETGGYLSATGAPTDLKLSNQMTSVIAARMQTLSAECRKALALASCIGDRFSLPVLCAVSGGEEETLLDLLEEGMRQRILLNEGQEFQFTHPLVRHVLYTTLSAPRRQRMHAQIAEALEREYGANIDAHLLEVAHHVVNAGSAVGPEKVVQYARRAGDYAFSMFAWGEAARYYEAALAAPGVAEKLSVHEQAMLLFRAGLARYRDMDVGPCLDHFEQAITAYRAIGEVQKLAEVLIARTRAYITQAAVPFGTLADVHPLEEILTELGDREPILRGRISAILAETYWHARRTEEAEQMARQALKIGQENDNAPISAYASHVLALAHMQSLQPQEALASWQNALVFARRANDLWLQTWPMTRIPWVLTALGQLEEAEAVAIDACVLTRKLHNWAEYSMAKATLAVLGVIKGDFATTTQNVEEVMLMVRRSHYPWGGARSLPALACMHSWHGAWSEAEEALSTLVEPGRVFTEAGPALQTGVRMYHRLVQSYTGTGSSTHDQSPLNPPRAMGKGRFDIGALPGLCAFTEAVYLTAAPTNVEPLYQTLALARERGIAFTTEWVFLLPRILGVAATLNRWWKKAETHFQDAIAIADKVGARPELGRSFLDYARMLATWNEPSYRTRVLELLEKANRIFDELDMQPFLQQTAQLALTFDYALPQSSRSIPPQKQLEREETKLRVIFFSDMVGSTALLQRLGDVKAQAITREHNVIVRACLRQHGGVELQHTGDGFMASFVSVSTALACALAIHRAFAEVSHTRPQTPVQVRIGLNAGEPLPEEGRLFGAAVNVAARICSQAQGGEVLVSEAVRQLATGKGFVFIDRGLFELKGLTGPFRLYAVRQEGDDV
jgi:class 3 adenylate cyclase